MLTFEYEQPLLISGVYITEEMLSHLSYLQTGTNCITANFRRHNNEGVQYHIDEICAITNHLLGNLVDSDIDEKPQIIELLESAYMLRVMFERLKLPPELLTPE